MTTYAARLERAFTLPPYTPNFERMFMAACEALAAVSECLALDPDDGGAEPIIAAIEKLKSGPYFGHYQQALGRVATLEFQLEDRTKERDAALALASEIPSLEADYTDQVLRAITAEKLAADRLVDAERLDFVLAHDAFIAPVELDHPGIRFQLWFQDEGEAYHVLSGDHKSFATEREAIDAAIKAAS
ncbi:hypothetical protein [Rhodoferax ferrireducens]|uniref:hypothetical protein n=1 Tax=Rhodoferax ferrireducens TaxID=192843 RepID=UPI0013007FBD|nr:hypothetical protein [Rhodoferax ferrireducens]